MKITKTLFTLCVCFTFMVNQSCYTYRVRPADVTPASEPKKMTQWFFLWGNVLGKNKPQPKCNRNGLAAVEIESSFGGNLLTILTLGVVHPVKVTWQCHQCITVE